MRGGCWEAAATAGFDPGDAARGPEEARWPERPGRQGRQFEDPGGRMKMMRICDLGRKCGAVDARRTGNFHDVTERSHFLPTVARRSLGGLFARLLLAILQGMYLDGR